RRCRIKVEVILFYVFAVIALIPCEAEQTLFENRIAPIPKSQCEANSLVSVADAADPVFSPAIRARACVLVRKIFPGGPVRAVVFTDRSPLALAEVGPPALPVPGALMRFVQTL